LRSRSAPEQRAIERGRADVLIVGNGIAGCVAAMEARRHAPEAEIVIVTEQNHPTINTPALKQFGAGHLALEELLTQPAGAERQLHIGVVNQRVERLDVSARQVHLRNGQSLGYGCLLLATGSRPAGVPDLPGQDFDGVMTLHQLSDYLDLRRRLPEVSAAVVVGGGYHAAETALLLQQAKIRVTWLIRGRGMLPDLLDAPASDLLLRYVQRQGVDVRLETATAGFVGKMGAVVGALSTAGTFFPAQLVVAAIGVRPNTELARGTDMGMQMRYGLRVNDHLQTLVPEVYAAGAVASILNPQTGNREPRAQWYFAFQQGRLAGAALAGAQIPATALTAAMGAFWHATQFGRLRILMAGAPGLSERDDPGYEVLCNGKAGFYRRAVLRNGRLVGYVAIGAQPPSGLAMKRIIDEQIDVREVASHLVDEEFDARSFFTRRGLRYIEASMSMPEVSTTPRANRSHAQHERTA
jgi:NAD(P)H-nitrite reductase large subunit